MNSSILEVLSNIHNKYIKDLNSIEIFSIKRKNYSRVVIDAYLKSKLGLNLSQHLKSVGLSLKTCPVSKGGLTPIEPLRLASLSLASLVNESWEDTELCKALSGIIILPLIVEAKNLGQPFRIVGKAFIWVPSPIEIDGLKSDWVIFKTLAQKGALPKLRGGKNDSLSFPSEVGTKFIHMKPHSVKGKFELDSYGREVRKMAFYLNSAHLRKLILSH